MLIFDLHCDGLAAHRRTHTCQETDELMTLMCLIVCVLLSEQNRQRTVRAQWWWVGGGFAVRHHRLCLNILIWSIFHHTCFFLINGNTQLFLFMYTVVRQRSEIPLITLFTSQLCHYYMLSLSFIRPHTPTHTHSVTYEVGRMRIFCESGLPGAPQLHCFILFLLILIHLVLLVWTLQLLTCL